MVQKPCVLHRQHGAFFFAVSAVGAQGRGTSEAGEVSLIVKGWVPMMYDAEQQNLGLWGGDVDGVEALSHTLSCLITTMFLSH